ncbi:hypothetical protein D3C85_1728810 [compost metagenome]
MFLPRQVTASVSGLKRWPWQTSHSTFTSGRKLMPMVRTPWPSQAGQRPSPVLNEKREALYPRALASSVSANIFRIASQTPI